MERAMASRVPRCDLKRPLVYEVGRTGTSGRCGNDSGGPRLFRVCRLVTKGGTVVQGAERTSSSRFEIENGKSAGFAAGRGRDGKKRVNGEGKDWREWVN